MRKYLTQKTEIESSFKVRADTLGEQFTTACEEASVYNEDTKKSKIAAAREAYITALKSARNLAESMEETMFNDARYELTAFLTKAPTPAQTSYLQALALLSEPTPDDIEKAVQVAKGNAIAEQVVAEMAKRVRGVIFAEPDPIDLRVTLDGLDEFEQRRVESIMRYGEVDALGELNNWHDICFTPNSSCSALDALDEAIERYA